MWLPWSENIKKRACRYLLQRYLGNFLLEKLTLDQLSVDLYNGTGTVSDVSLDCEALNELGDSQSWPLEIVDGYMNQITVTIPWSTLFKDDSVVEVNGLSITVQPKVRNEQASGMLESMWSSMSSSMQLAAECLRQEDGPPDAHPVEGIEMFAHAIDSILTRVKIKFINTKIRIEHVPKNSGKGIAMEIHVKKIDYFDEASTEPLPNQTDPEKTKTYIVSTFTSKKIAFEGVTLYTDEFPSKLRTMAPSLIMEKSMTSQTKEIDASILESDVNFQSATSEVFSETKSSISEPSEAAKDDFLEQISNPEVRREVTPEERANQPDPILFAKLTGIQDLTLKIKHTEESIGPKVDIQLTLGSFVIFCSPRQLHTLFELADGISQPHLEDTSNIPMRSTNNLQCKPMRQADYQYIEQQLHANLTKQSNKYSFGHGWSGHSFDDSDVESDKFHPMSGAQMADSFSSSVSSMSASMSSSVHVPTSQPRIKRNKKVPQIDGDPTAEVSHINITIASCSCILLHKDVLARDPISIDCISPASARKMQELSSQFFQRLGLFYLIGNFKDIDAANETFDNATNKSHLRLITTSLSFDGNEKTTNQGSQTSGQGLIANLLLRECLYYDTEKPESFDLVRFNTNDDNDEESNENTSTIEPNVSITFIQTLKYVRVSGEKKLLHPTTEISIKCNPLYADIELTLLERMAATFFGSSTSNLTMQQTPVSRSQNQLNFSLDCPKLDAILRFPIADLRPGINREIRRVRSDYLMFKFEDVLITCLQEQSLRPLPTTISIMASTIDLYYHENENAPGTHIARTNKDVTVDSNMLRGTGMMLPTISLTFQPSKPTKGPFDSSDEEPCDPHSPSLNPMTQSIYLMDKVKDTSQPSPFSSKKMAHQGILSHENSKSHTEELIEPGSDAEMEQFTRSSVERSNIHLDLNLPIVSLQLESKQIYEIIYNRINTDLLLWEPQTTTYDITPLMPFTTDMFPEPSIYPAFGMCKSGNAYESDTSSSSSEEDNVYYSIYDPKLKNAKNNNKNRVDKKGNHDFCFTMNIGNGLMTVYTPLRDNNKRVVPCQLGELVVKASKVSMCQVTGVNGRSRHALMCLRAAQATLYHAPLISVPTEKPPLRMYKSTLPSHLKETIYPSGPNVLLKDRVGKKDMLTLALSVEPHNDLPNFKKVCMALGIEQATLRHRGNAGITWLTQLLDVLDVLDYPIPGYQPSTVLTEMHVHMMDCAVDYRPLYLPTRTVLTLGNFSVSSNVVAQTSSTNLKFLAQECALFLHHIPGTKPGVAVPLDDDKQPDLHKDYICVVDLGLFELSLKMNDKADHTGPHVDLCASNNAVNVRTCWDSASALCRLVTYIAVDGDTTAPTDASVRHSSFCSDRTDEPLLAGLDDKLEEIPELSPSEIQQVNDLMEEAMQESPNTTCDEDINISSEKEGVEIFFFPDEPNSKQKVNNSTENVSLPIETEGVVDFSDFTSGVPDLAEEAKPTTAQVIKELGDPTSTPRESPMKGKRKTKTSGGDTDDEYCIIETQTSGEDDDLAEPVIKWFTNEPVPMIENHFTVPAAKSDVLKAPKSFPTPVLRYTLYEMSVTWHMYGGSDFKTTNDCSTIQKKNVTINEVENRIQGSPTSTKRNIDYEPYETSRATTAAYRQTGVAWSSGHDRVRTHKSEMPTRDIWKTRGGKDRDLNTLVQMQLSKIKFQHEVYPSGGNQASRQTLAVAKIEIIDRLANSSINKFLSQYVLKDEPERKNAHMLVIKAVHLRPEPAMPAQECCLKVSLLPLRFIIDQDTLAFLIAFFSKLGTDEPNDEDTKSLGGISTESSSSRQTTPTHRAPVMSVANHLKDPPPTPTSLTDSDHDASHMIRDEPLMENYEAERLVSENLIQLEEDFQKLGVTNERQTAQPTPDAELTDDSPVYFRRVVFAPDVPIRLDYVGKRVDFSAGPVTGLLMGLGQLNCSELRLKRLYHRHGLLGLEKLLRWALQEWLADIKLHQLPGLLSGIGPMHSLLQFITGIRDLVWLPVEQWRRDGRLVHGIRRGAASFTARTAVAALDITTRIIHVIQATAETAFDMLTPGPTLQLQQTYERRQRRRRRRYDPSRQPSDIREGVASAYQTVKEGFAETAATMALAARSERGVGVLRHLPGAAVAPLALAAAGAADVLGGVRAQLAPDLRRDHADRWRPHQQSSMD